MPTLNGRDRMMAALSAPGSDAFPVVLPYLEILLRDHREAITSVPWWAECAGDIYTRLQTLHHLIEAVPIDWVCAEWCAPRAWRERHRVVVEAGRAYLEERDTGERREVHPPPPGGFQSLPRQVLVQSEADIERLLPGVEHGQCLADGSLDYARLVVEAFGRDRFVFASLSAPFWHAHSYLSFEGLMTAVVENGALLHRLLERLAARQVEAVRAFAAIGIDGVWVEDCFSSADLISRRHFHEFALPYAERVVSEIERRGMRAIYYFCGDVSDRLEDLVALRPAALSLEESKKGFRIDLGEVAERVRGRCALLGNLDAVGVLEGGSESALQAAVTAQAAVGRRWPRFAFSLGSPVTAATPLGRVQEFVRLARDAAVAR